MPLTKKQREWVLERNGGKCQYCYKGDDGKWYMCGSTEDVEVHHILPEKFAEKNVKSTDPNRAGNLISICASHHTGKKRRRR